MSQGPHSSSEARDHLARAVAALRARLPHEPRTRLIDFAGCSEADLEELFRLADGFVAVVVLHLRHDAAYRAEGPPQPFTDLETCVLAHASELVRKNIRASDLVMRTGRLDLAVVLLRAGPLEARAQAWRLRSFVAGQRFEQKGYEVFWRGRLGLATHQPGPTGPGAGQVLRTLFDTAS